MSLKQLLLSKVRIIQSSRGRTGSTLLTNALYGLFCYDEPFCYSQKNITQDHLKNHFIIKTHNIDLDAVAKNNSDYSLFFVCSERPEMSGKIHAKYRNRTNVIIFNYQSDLLEKTNFTIENIVSRIISKLELSLPKDIRAFCNRKQCIQRIIEMNEFYNSIKHLPFSYYDNHYGIHGSHKNRDTKF